MHCHIAHIRLSHGINLLLRGPRPHVSPAYGVKLVAPLPHISRRWNPSHQNEISRGPGWILRGYAEPKQHTRAIRAPQPQYTTRWVLQEWQYQRLRSIQTQICMQKNTPSTITTMETDVADYASKLMGNGWWQCRYICHLGKVAIF